MLAKDRVAIRYILPVLLCLLVAAAVVEFSVDSTVEVKLSNQGTSSVEARKDFGGLDYHPSGTQGLSVLQGAEFPTLSELDAAQNRAGYVRIGLFGNYWPARIVEIAEDDGGIRFTRAGGTPHSYSGFKGYRLQMIRLVQGSHETIVVYRGQTQSF